MAEMIIPGTYISVRAEGLISAGRIATGIVGIVGTAVSGPIKEPVTLSGFAAARELFGLPDDFEQPDDGSHPVSLVRSLALAYNNGASSVIAVRVAGKSAASATYTLRAANGDAIAVLTAKTPGTWANDMQVLVEKSPEDCNIRSETLTNTFDRLRYSNIRQSAENRIRIQRGVTKRTETLQIVYKGVVTEPSVPAMPPASPGGPASFTLANKPVENVPTINRVRVLDSSGTVVREYADPKILYDASATPGKGEVRINKQTGELTFEASEVPSSTQQVEATYAVGHAAPQSGEVLLTTWDGTLQFPKNEAPKKSDGDRLVASYVVDRSMCVRVQLTAGTVVERYVAPDGQMLAELMNDRKNPSTLVKAVPDSAHSSSQPQTSSQPAFFGTGSNTPGNNGADAGSDEYAEGLDALSNMLVNIVILAGQDATKMGDVLAGHLKQTGESDHERIGVIGASGKKAPDFLGHHMADERIVLVAPGIKYPPDDNHPDGLTLPPAYMAAAVAGVISALPVQGSLTNKTVNVPGLSVALNRGQQEQLIRRNVLTVVDKEGFRVLKGVTTAGEGTPFSSIPTRRIVDYAKYGVRSAANSYIGRLNNARVRGALKATLDAFLTGMVEDEALTAYELEVTATRAQEIAGEVNVAMTLQPTFSIEYIRVTMILK